MAILNSEQNHGSVMRGLVIEWNDSTEDNLAAALWKGLENGCYETCVQQVTLVAYNFIFFD